MVAILLTGFSSGLPLALSWGTLQAWMKAENVDITVVGLVSLVGWPYTVKFLWSPLMDRYSPPFLGRRRGWILLTQGALALSLVALGFSKPSEFPFMTALVAVFVAFFSASQDIVVDAYRTVLVEKSEVGQASSMYIIGYRVGYLISTGGALVMASYIPWKWVYVSMALLIGFCMIGTLFMPVPVTNAKPPQSIKDAVWLPFVDFFKRTGSLEIIAFITLYKLDTNIAQALLTPFLMDMQFSLTDIGVVKNSLGLFATIAGTLIAGRYMTRLGIKKSLWIFGAVQGFSGLAFMALAHLGHNYPMLVVATILEFLCGGMGTVAYSGFILSICNKRFSATQYALLTSLMALTRTIGISPAGYLQKFVGWEMYFFISVIVMVPGLIFLFRYDRWEAPNEDAVAY